MRLLSLIENPPTKLRKGQKILTALQIERKYRPLVVDIGLLVVSWSRLQETLARLFWFVTGIENGAIPLAIWHSTKSDRAQREMLREAAEVAFVSTLLKRAKLPTAASNKRANEDIVWLVNKANSLADKRNDVMHTPYLVALIEPKNQDNQLIPEATYGNPRALKLKGKDLRKEFIWYRGHADELCRFAYDLGTCIRWPDSVPWPDRPELPHHGQPPSPKTKRRKTTPKLPPHPPQPSEA